MCTRSGVAVAAALFSFAFYQAALAASQPSGTAIAVVQQSVADGETGRRALATAGPVFSGDRIITGAIGEAQLSFRDGTKLVVGPNSSMLLDAFVFNADNTARQVTIEVAKGAFRFITGNGPKDAYTINTPTATISVRGTQFDFEVEPVGTTRVAVFQGATITCDRVEPALRTCIQQTANCQVSIVQRGRGPRPIASKDEREGELRLYFPYVLSQRSLLAPFRVDVASCGLGLSDPLLPPVTAPSPDTVIRAVITAPPGNEPSPPPPPPPPPPNNDHDCGGGGGGNCGNGNGNGGGNGTGNEGNGKGPSDEHTNNGKGKD